MASENIKILTDDDFADGTASGVVLVDFSAEWCGPCRMMLPVIEELAAEMNDKVVVAKVDTDQSPETATKYEVTSIPTLVLFKDGEVVKRVSGLRDLDTLRSMVNEAF